MYRIGVDVGGTFTDCVVMRPDGSLLLEKAPTTPGDQSDGVVNALTQAAAAEGLSLDELLGQTDTIVHGTTTGDNTMIQMTGAPTGLIVTKGFRDEIEFRRCYKEDIWDPTLPAPYPIARRRVRLEVDERMTAEGEVETPLDEEGVRKATARLRAFGVTSIAISFLHSYLNHAHELRAREIVLDEYPDVEMVSLSHEVLPKPPEFERTSTTLVNAYVGPPIARYLGRLTARLAEAGYAHELLVATSSGGVATADAAARRAVATIGSGPTGGVTRVGEGRRQGRPRRRGQRRHGRHELRRLPDPRRPARDQDGLELVPSLLHRHPDDRHPVGRRRRRLDRLGRGRRASRRPAVGAEPARPGLLRPRRHRADGHRRRPGARPACAGGLRERPDDARRRGCARRARRRSASGSA